MKKIIDRVGWGTMLVLAAIVSAYAFTFLFLDLGDSSEVKARFLEYALAGYSHVFGGGIALLLGPFVLSTKFRKRNLNLHRWMGRIYLVGVLASGSAGLFLSTVTMGGPSARLGFGMLAVFWLTSGTMAYIRIRQKRKPLHKMWMYRNYALTLAAVSLRLGLPAMMANGFEFDTAYQVIAWMCWVPNLIIAEWWFLRRR